MGYGWVGGSSRTFGDVIDVYILACTLAQKHSPQLWVVSNSVYSSISQHEMGSLGAAGGVISRQVEEEVKQLTQQALTVAKSVILANQEMHAAMSRQLETAERLEGDTLQEWLGSVVVPEDLRNFVQHWQKQIQ